MVKEKQAMVKYIYLVPDNVEANLGPVDPKEIKRVLDMYKALDERGTSFNFLKFKEITEDMFTFIKDHISYSKGFIFLNSKLIYDPTNRNLVLCLTFSEAEEYINLYVASLNELGTTLVEQFNQINQELKSATFIQDNLSTLLKEAKSV